MYDDGVNAIDFLSDVEDRDGNNCIFIVIYYNKEGHRKYKGFGFDRSRIKPYELKYIVECAETANVTFPSFEELKTHTNVYTKLQFDQGNTPVLLGYLNSISKSKDRIFLLEDRIYIYLVFHLLILLEYI
jgi:hypothetical protein